VQSSKCHLDRLSPAELVRAKEEATELGGYFIIHGLEKLIRLLCMPRRNYVCLPHSSGVCIMGFDFFEGFCYLPPTANRSQPTIMGQQGSLLYPAWHPNPQREKVF